MQSVLIRWRAIAWLALLATLLAPPPASAQRLQTYAGSDRELAAPVSGPSAPIGDLETFYDQARIDIGTGVQLPLDKKFYGVKGIALQETGDEPCKLELYGSLLDPNASSATVLVGQWTLFGCELQRTDSWRMATLAALPRHFVRSVRACHGASPFVDLKMKGLMVSSAAVLDDGSIVALPELPCVDRKTPHCFARPHCKSWATLSTCPPNQIVVGVTIYYYAENDVPPRAISAIQPWCQGIRKGSG